jgi:SAM-dependent methyltransferase
LFPIIKKDWATRVLDLGDMLEIAFDSDVAIRHVKDLTCSNGPGQNNTGHVVTIRQWENGYLGSSGFNLTNRVDDLTLFFPEDVLNIENMLGKIVVDIGCGGGGWVETLRSQGVNAFGVDLVLTASQLASPYYVRGRAEAKLFVDQSVDIFFSSNSLFSYGSSRGMRVSALKNMIAALRPEGRIFISDNSTEIAKLVEDHQLELEIVRVKTKQDYLRGSFIELKKSD